MFEWFRQIKSAGSLGIWRQAPESLIDEAVRQFLADTARIAEDAAVVIDGDIRRLIQQHLSPADALQYESIIRVPGAFPPYLVWAALAALDALPLGDVLEPALAKRVEMRLLDVAAQTRGKLNARLLSALLYRLQRVHADGDAAMDALVIRFWEEVQRMGALSEEGSDILSDSRPACETLAGRLHTASILHNRQYGGNFWVSVKAPIEQEAHDLGWI